MINARFFTSLGFFLTLISIPGLAADGSTFRVGKLISSPCARPQNGIRSSAILFRQGEAAFALASQAAVYSSDTGYCHEINWNQTQFPVSVVRVDVGPV